MEIHKQMTIRVFLARVLSTCFRGFALGEVNRQKRIAAMTSLSGPWCVSDSVCLFSLFCFVLLELRSCWKSCIVLSMVKVKGEEEV